MQSSRLANDFPSIPFGSLSYLRLSSVGLSGRVLLLDDEESARREVDGLRSSDGNKGAEDLLSDPAAVSPQEWSDRNSFGHLLRSCRDYRQAAEPQGPVGRGGQFSDTVGRSRHRPL